MTSREYLLTSRKIGWWFWLECEGEHSAGGIWGVRAFGLFLWLARWRARRKWNKLNRDPSVITEGKVRKGGVSDEPKTPRPAHDPSPQAQPPEPPPIHVVIEGRKPQPPPDLIVKEDRHAAGFEYGEEENE